MKGGVSVKANRIISMITAAVMTASASAVFGGSSMNRSSLKAAAELDENKTYNSWQEAYREVLEDFTEDITYDNMSKNNLYYSVFVKDLNADGIPELFRQSPTSVMPSYLCTFYDQKIKSLGGFVKGGDISYCPEDNIVLASGGSAGYAYFQAFRIENGEIVMIDDLFSDTIDKQTLNGKDITRYEYTATVQKYQQKTDNDYMNNSIELKTSNLYKESGKIIYSYYFDHYEAFYAYPEITTTVNIANTVNGLPVTSIGKDFLSVCSAKTLYIPANIDQFYYTGLNGSELTAINVDPSNDGYTSVDGVLYSKDMSELLKYPTAKDASAYSFSDSIYEIGSCAFAWCKNLKKITIPRNIYFIDSFAFYCCPDLSSVTILQPHCYIEDYWDDGFGATICNSDDGSVKCKYLGVISGYDNSGAQKYANNFDRTFISLGPDPYATTTTTTTTTTSTTTTTTSTTTTTTTTTQKVASTTTIDRSAAGPAAGDLSYFSNIDADSSYVKPILSLSRIELSQEEAKAAPVRTIELSVSGADLKYSLTGIHITWDSRLTLEGSEDDITRGDALKRVSIYDAVKDGSDGVFVTSGSIKNDGKDGVMFSFPLRIPSDCKPGDIYPIQIKYRNTSFSSDMFTTYDKDKQGQLMEAWVFTKGIIQGYIKIKEEPAPEYTLGDVTRDGSINAVDASSVLAYYAMVSTNKDGGYDDAQKLAADVTSDGTINAVDASNILSYYAYTSTAKENVISMEEFMKQRS